MVSCNLRRLAWISASLSALAVEERCSLTWSTTTEALSVTARYSVYACARSALAEKSVASKILETMVSCIVFSFTKSPGRTRSIDVRSLSTLEPLKYWNREQCDHHCDYP